MKESEASQAYATKSANLPRSTASEASAAFGCRNTSGKQISFHLYFFENTGKHSALNKEQIQTYQESEANVGVFSVVLRTEWKTGEH